MKRARPSEEKVTQPGKKYQLPLPNQRAFSPRENNNFIGRVLDLSGDRHDSNRLIEPEISPQYRADQDQAPVQECPESAKLPQGPMPKAYYQQQEEASQALQPLQDEQTNKEKQSSLPPNKRRRLDPRSLFATEGARAPADPEANKENVYTP